MVAVVFPEAVNILPQQVLDLLPQDEFKPRLPVVTLSNPSQGQYGFYNFMVLPSSKIAGESVVSGNVTFYYTTWYPEPWQPYVRVLTLADYKRAKPEDSLKLNVATLLDLGRCCVNQTHYGGG